MSSDVPLEAKAMADDDVELILEDEADDDEVQLLNQEGEQMAPTAVEEEEDDDIELIEDPDLAEIPPEPEPTKFFTDEFFESAKELKEATENFFHPTSPTNVANLSQDKRQAMAKYAAALFEWICCLPDVDVLVVIPAFADINLPFPITPDRQRILIKREYGLRLSDVWRQTKSTVKMANHFKLKENVALLTLLDYVFVNPNYDMDVMPLLKAHEINRQDYYLVASFVVTNCEPRLWKEPEDLIMDSFLPPIAAAVALCLLKMECTAGKETTIPWETLDRDLASIPMNVLMEHDQILLEGFKQLRLGDESRKKEDELRQRLQTVKKDLFELKKEQAAIHQHIHIRRGEIAELSRNYVNILNMRQQHAGQILPEKFEEKGEALAKDEDIIVTASIGRYNRANPAFSSMYLKQSDFAMSPDISVLARRKEDAPEKFQKAQVLRQEGNDWVVRFHSDQSTATIPLSAIAEFEPMRGRKGKTMPVTSEGIRVAARARHPCRAKEAAALYSGTIISRFDVDTEEYAVAFDDSFEEYVSIREMHLMMAQCFNNQGVWDRASAHYLMTPNEKAPGPSEERRLFLLLFFSSYPEWNMVKMNEKVGKNISTLHRNGETWVAQALKVDRHMIWLRFNPKETGFDSSAQSCLDFPCKQHDHLDEKMYRGNPRLKQVRSNCEFDRALAIYRNADVKIGMTMHHHIMLELQKVKKTRHEQRHIRRMHAASGIAFEPAIANESKVQGKQGKKGQTARKTGAGLQVEPEVQDENKIKKREQEVRIEHHKADLIEYTVERGEGKPDHFHAVCTNECLKGLDADPFDPRFLSNTISPFYVPIMCGWRRIKQTFTFSGPKGPENCVYYRAPCGRPLQRMTEVIDYLEATRSELTVDLFTFSFDVDETAYVTVEDWAVKLMDISNGAEARPIPVINEIDKEQLPSFIYRARRYPLRKEILMTTTNKEFCSGCDCIDDCRDWTKCACQRLTHRESVRAQFSFKHVTNGYTNRLLLEKVDTGIYECNENCGCSRKRCINRVVQNELKVPMHMMKTYGMGWGVRTLVDIPKGTFISCYHGAVLSDAIAETNEEGDEYYADLDFYNLVETEKENSGVDTRLDYGVFFDDVGTRELTEAEKNAAEKEDELEKFRKEANKQRRKMQRLEQKMMKVVVEEVEEEIEDWEEIIEGEEGGGEEGQEKGDEEGGGREEETEEEEEVDDGVDVDEGDMEDEEEEEGGVSNENSMSPLDETNKKEAEERKEREREEKRRKDEKSKEDAAKNKKDTERRKRLHEESKGRYTIPVKDDDTRYQLDAYFEDADCDNLFLIDAKGAGNIGRQYNHSCDPNMFTQHIFVDTHDIRLPWVAFFAKRDIKAGEELTWDYGWHVNEENPRGLKCQCGAPKCRIDLL